MGQGKRQKTWLICMHPASLEVRRRLRPTPDWASQRALRPSTQTQLSGRRSPTRSIPPDPLCMNQGWGPFLGMTRAPGIRSAAACCSSGGRSACRPNGAAGGPPPCKATAPLPNPQKEIQARCLKWVWWQCLLHSVGGRGAPCEGLRRPWFPVPRLGPNKSEAGYAGHCAVTGVTQLPTCWGGGAGNGCCTLSVSRVQRPKPDKISSREISVVRIRS